MMADLITGLLTDALRRLVQYEAACQTAIASRNPVTLLVRGP